MGLSAHSNLLDPLDQPIHISVSISLSPGIQNVVSSLTLLLVMQASRGGGILLSLRLVAFLFMILIPW